MRVLIVGGGIIGAACAWALAGQGAQVVILDRDDPPGGATARADGGLLLFNKRVRDAALALEALEAWRAILPLLDGMEAEPNASLLVACDEATEEALAEQASALKGAGMPLTELSGDACRSQVPGLAPAVRYGIRCDAQLRVQPMLSGVAMLHKAKEAGAEVRAGVRVRAVGPGTVATDTGDMSCDEVLVAAGAWSPQLLAGTPYEIPIEPRRGHNLVAERGASSVVGPGALDGAYMTAAHSQSAELFVVPTVVPASRGTALIGASRERVGFDLSFKADVMRRLCQEALRIYPGLEGFRIVRGWVGFRPWVCDGYPLVGRLEEGLSIAAGHEGEGITYAPLTAAAIVRAVAGGLPPRPEWDPLRFTRRRRDEDRRPGGAEADPAKGEPKLTPSPPRSPALPPEAGQRKAATSGCPDGEM